jgi:hypothetical protein
MGLVAACAVIACIFGWHVSRVHMSHRGIPVRRRQLHEYRGERTHHAIRFVGLAVLFVLILIGGALLLH